MDLFDILFVIVWAVILFGSFSGGKRKKRRGAPPREESGGDDKSSQEEAYDYKALRDRIRTSWGLPGEQATETSEEGSAETVALSSSVEEQSSLPTDVQRYLDYLRAGREKPEQNPIPAALAVERLGIYRRGADIAWTEEDMRRWVVYDAVLGAPRGYRKWRSVTGR